MRWFHRALLRLILAIISHPRLTLAIAALAFVAAGTLAAVRLTISTDQNQLFNAKVPFFRNYLDYIGRFHENEAVYITIEARDPAHAPPLPRWTAAADAIDSAERRLTNYVDDVQSHVDIDSLGDSALLYEEPRNLPADAERLSQFVRLAVHWAQPSLGESVLGRTPVERTITEAGLQSPPEAATAQFVGLVARELASAVASSAPMRRGQQVPDLAALSATTPTSLGYIYTVDASNPANHLLLIEVFAHRDFTSLTAISRAVNAIRDTAYSAGSAAFPEFDIGVTGRPALEADQMQTTDRDSHLTEAVALSFVFILLTLSLRSVWLALASELSLLFGIAWTFGWATLAVGRLNILSIVFLIALIGIGMDYLVQILSRYRQEAARSDRQSVIWTNVFRHVALPINTACAGAAGAFLVATLTDFRGAAELGIIAGGGLFLCLVAGYTVLPALLVLFPPRIEFITREQRRHEHRYRPQAARWRILLIPIWIVPLLLGLRWIRSAGFDNNLLKLQAPDIPSVKLINKLQPWSAVVLSQNLDTLRQVRAAVLKSPLVDHTDSFLNAVDNHAYLTHFAPTVPGLSTIHWVTPPDITPADLTTIASKSRALANKFATQPGPDFASGAQSVNDLAAVLEHPADPDLVARRLTDWQAVFVTELQSIVGKLTPPAPDINAAPAVLRSHWRSDDGYWALYILPDPKMDLWVRAKLEQFERDIESRVAAVPGAPPVTGITSDIYHSTGAIQASFYTSAAYALSLIFILVLLDLRHIGHTLIAIGVLALGIPVLIEIMGRFGIDWNFANFFGLPILIGAGHEYGVFMIHRYREALHDHRRDWTTWDTSDKALLLCALITSSSFGFFFALAQHRGLKSLGLVMALGTACIYLATILVVRPILMWLLDRRRKRIVPHA